MYMYHEFSMYLCITMLGVFTDKIKMNYKQKLVLHGETTTMTGGKLRVPLENKSILVRVEILPSNRPTTDPSEMTCIYMAK